MDAAKTVTAVFAVDQYPLTILVTGQGTVAADPAGNPHTTGTTVTLTPAPAAGWHFDHWEGDLSGSATPGLVVMDAPKTVTAVFAETLYALNVTTRAGGGCPQPARRRLRPGTQVTLSATPDTDAFRRVAGGSVGRRDLDPGDMDAAKSVTAVLSGRSTPDRAAHGRRQRHPDPPGAPTPTRRWSPSPQGNRFEIWGGELSGTAEPITLTVTANIT
jgi:hypothetical protein